MPKLSNRADLALAALIRVCLIGALVHCGMIVAGYFAAVMDGQTEVGFPWVFASWGGLCYGTCSWFSADHLVATVSFWLALATAWAWLKVTWAAKNPEPRLIRK